MSLWRLSRRSSEKPTDSGVATGRPERGLTAVWAGPNEGSASKAPITRAGIFKGPPVLPFFDQLECAIWSTRMSGTLYQMGRRAGVRDLGMGIRKADI